MLQQAARLHQAGRLAEAEAAYRALLSVEPANAEAQHLLGVLLQQTGRVADAENLMRRAVSMRPRAAVYRASLGQILHDQGKFEEAASSLRHAVRLDPKIAELHYRLGASLARITAAREAEQAFRRALVLQPGFTPARIELGHLLLAAGRAAEAEACLREAVRHAPRDPAALNALGAVLMTVARHGDALWCFDAALEISPGEGSARTNRAACLLAAGRLEDAARAYQALLDADPENAQLMRMLGQILPRLGRAPETEILLRGLLRHAPDDADINFGLGAMLVKKNRPAEALPYLQQACLLAPSHAEAQHAHGLALRDLGDWTAALPWLREAARLAPQNPELRTSFSYALMVHGDFAAGWPEFEWRLEQPGAAKIDAPRWQGEVTGKTVLVHAEQGVGDTIQFARFVRLAAERARIVFAGPKSVARLFADLPDGARFVEAEPPPEFDLHCPLMSLPLVLGAAAEDFAASVPYLHAPAPAAERWRDRLAALAGRRVGLVWAGNPLYAADHRRSLHLEQLRPVLEVSGCSFISLQVGEARAQLAGIAPGRVTDLGAELEDFADTAALLESLDVLISVDTATAHLAGALGRPVWLLNRIDTDWRWGLRGEACRWYPSMRVFRQTEAEMWDPVIGALCASLAAVAADRR